MRMFEVILTSSVPFGPTLDEPGEPVEASAAVELLNQFDGERIVQGLVREVPPGGVRFLLEGDSRNGVVLLSYTDGPLLAAITPEALETSELLPITGGSGQIIEVQSVYLIPLKQALHAAREELGEGRISRAVTWASGDDQAALPDRLYDPATKSWLPVDGS